ncbi:trypsin-like serine peptidase [Paenibacillus sp. 481]|uniref:trypsin-like serine peptidase n=1 Tax=Paenibacillus sp. 481 TaxID=2835869 RepID=UPI001E445AC0|nr:trypsin-like serine protease [Paenibacillus sp. 481]UHA72439.1 trypsin-like serine protease [Paenibacillus sp. 481]
MLKKGFLPTLCFTLMFSFLSLTQGADNSNASNQEAIQLHNNSIQSTASLFNTRDLPDVIIGEDERYLISDPAAEEKYKHIGKLTFTSGSGSRSFCTANLVSPTVALTSAHCAYNRASAKYSTNMTIQFAKNIDSHTVQANVTRVFVPSQYITAGGTSNDWAVLKLDRRVSNSHFIVSPGNAQVGDTVEIAGYPGDLGGQEMYGHTNQITNIIGNTIHHNMDTAGGQSGSAIASYPYLKAVHSGGVRGSHNVAALANTSMVSKIAEFNR